MENTLRFEGTYAERSEKRHFMLDTTFVLFFLSMDLGQSLLAFGFDSALSGITLGLLVVLPYYLPYSGEKPEFKGWILGRVLILIFALSMGIMFNQALGVVLPASLGYLPMTLLIVAAFISCMIQLYGIMRFRLAR
jgi:hypothetical protein